MTDDEINEKIARYLFNLKGLDYDAEVKELESVVDASSIQEGYGGGCDTCGWGADPATLDLKMVVTYRPTHGKRAIERLYVETSYADCLLHLLKDTPNAY